MMDSLEDLKSGKLIGATRLKLSCGLTSFPEEILSLSETLEVLDLSDNELFELPESVSKLKRLKIIFFARNKFTEFPIALSQLPVLSMVGFKSNQISSVRENAFPPLLRWLILTDNKIEKLPSSIGACNLLQKCGLAGNQLTTLPDELANCKNLELLRIASNKLEKLPDWLFELPKLSWIAIAGNPSTHQVESVEDLGVFSYDDFEIKNLLGEGASGLISKADWKTKNKAVALKIFKGEVTSDGSPKDEMNISIAAGNHDSLIRVLGKIDGHPEGKDGLIMELISSSYFNLGDPPCMESCTRDVFDENYSINGGELLKIANSIASVCCQLHGKGINHGDLYGHNILVDDQANCLLGDFGAATFYDVNSAQALTIERVEVRAFACLLEDLMALVDQKTIDAEFAGNIESLIESCMSLEVKARPNFATISESLSQF